MKKIFFTVCSAFILLFSASLRADAAELGDFSDNKRLYIRNVAIEGNILMSEKEIFEISGFDDKTGFYVSEISKGIQSLVRCGYFSEVSYILDPVEKGYTLALHVKENPPLASLKIIESKMLDLSILKDKFRKNNVTTDMVFSPAMLEKAIEEFNIYNQSYGIFLYTISYRVVTKEEIKKEGGRFLYGEDELDKNGVHVIVYIREIPRLVIGEIRMKDITI
ncbi:MAG: hypothetical protein ACRCUT_04135, partial [Spirochaetota bacterium]